MPTPTLLWYDYETTGTDTVLSRPTQLAALRTDLDLHPLGDPSVLYCAPSADHLPQPEACLITGIAPQMAASMGLREADFAKAAHELMATAGTCAVGYNSIRFDDEINRNLFYRNFFDPYEHAWKNGCSRWDIMDLARACYALRPAGIEWPMREDASPSFRLEHLATANQLEQRRAHDALSDVEATVALARLLQQRQPRLYAWHFKLRDKKVVSTELASRLPSMQALLHVSARYPASRGCIAMVAPIAEHPERGGTYIVADLDVDPAQWVDLDVEQLAERLFTPREDLPEGMQRPPLKEIHANKSPFVAPIETLRDVDTTRIALDAERCLRHRETIRAVHGLRERVREVFAARAGAWPARSDPERMLYARFVQGADRRHLDRVRSTPPAQLAGIDIRFDDARYPELLFRYRARNWPETLDADEHGRWRDYVRDKLSRETETTTLTLAQYFDTLARLRATTPAGSGQVMLDQLQDWGETRRKEFGLGHDA